jgi:hypothetical protein
MLLFDDVKALLNRGILVTEEIGVTCDYCARDDIGSYIKCDNYDICLRCAEHISTKDSNLLKSNETAQIQHVRERMRDVSTVPVIGFGLGYHDVILENKTTGHMRSVARGLSIDQLTVFFKDIKINDFISAEDKQECEYVLYSAPSVIYRDVTSNRKTTFVL